ncbi:MAG TPA: hypothetical protein VI758_03565 [Bacteroidota bacterium]
MNSKSFRSAFVVFHITLGAVVFLQNVGTVVRATSGHLADVMRSHLLLLAIAEAIAAILFLLPKTARVGGGILLAIFAVALSIHGIRGELSLLVYAAGVVLVMIEGGTYKM